MIATFDPIEVIPIRHPAGRCHDESWCATPMDVFPPTPPPLAREMALLDDVATLAGRAARPLIVQDASASTSATMSVELSNRTQRGVVR